MNLALPFSYPSFLSLAGKIFEVCIPASHRDRRPWLHAILIVMSEDNERDGRGGAIPVPELPYRESAILLPNSVFSSFKPEIVCVVSAENYFRNHYISLYCIVLHNLYA
jgi:hypothetical protein